MGKELQRLATRLMVNPSSSLDQTSIGMMAQISLLQEQTRRAWHKGSALNADLFRSFSPYGWSLEELVDRVNRILAVEIPL